MSLALEGRDVPEEATLDAFVPDETDEGDDEAETETDATATTDSGVETDADATPPDAAAVDSDADGDLASDDEIVDPTSVTSSWRGDDGSCSACGEPAGRLWQDGDQRVCTACKPWTRSGEAPCDQ